MEQTRIGIDNFFTYEGLYPTVFKKMDPSDVSINAFQVYKKWTFTSGSSTSSALPLTAIYTNVLPILETELTYNDAANIDGSLQSIIYHSIDHMFYKYKNQPINTYGPTDISKTKKALFQSASILSIPQIKIGEKIKTTSFSFTSSVSGSFASDSYENIYDVAFNTASIVSGVTFYEGFNEYFDTNRISYNSAGITYTPGVTTTSGQQKSLGLSAQFNSTASIQIDIPGYYDRDHDYAISFFISGANSTAIAQPLVGKSDQFLSTRPFPFEIYNHSNSIKFVVASHTISGSITSQWTHVVCQKSSSLMSLYINGSLISSFTNSLLQPSNHPLSASILINNTASLSIGGYSNINTTGNGVNFNGKLDEIRIFNKALSISEIGYLADRTEGGTLLQTRNVGTIMPAQGLIIFSSADYRFQNLLNTPYTASYRSTKTIYELNALTRIDSGEFNLSTNISLTKDDNITYQSFITGSSFTPYITTIGLYNSNGQLLAIAKLAQPIKKRNDVDLNFLIKLDLDRSIAFNSDKGQYK